MQWLILCLFLPIFGQTNGSACVTPIGESAECISIYDCKLLLDAIHNKSYHDFLRQSECGRENSKPLVCCGTNLPTVDVNLETSMPESINLLPLDSECGRQDDPNKANFSSNDRHEFPWTTLFQYGGVEAWPEIACGGTLINNRYILTAARCVTKTVENSTKKFYQVRLGKWESFYEEICIDFERCATPPLYVRVEEIIPHPKYNESSKSRHNDIALVRLVSPVNYTDLIRPICLPKFQKHQAPTGAKLYLTRWDSNSYDIANKAKLNYTVSLLDTSTCKKQLNTTPIDLRFDQFCAEEENEGKNLCRNDIGDPLMHRISENNDDVWYIQGIFSSPAKCRSTPLLGVYTNVSSFIPWILANIKA